MDKIYDNNGTHTQQWAVVENRYDEASAVTLYTDEGYKGKAVTLSEGEYNLSRMGLYNLKDNDMSSLKVTPGFKVTIYEDDNFNGKVSHTQPLRVSLVKNGMIRCLR